MAAVTPTLNRGGPGLKSQAFNDKCGVLKNCAVNPTEFDLSGSAQTEALLCSPTAITVHSVKVFYSETTSANTGVAVSVGTYADTDAYGTLTSSTETAAGTVETMVSTAFSVPADTPLVAAHAGGKTGAGACYVYVEYTVDDER